MYKKNKRSEDCTDKNEEAKNEWDVPGNVGMRIWVPGIMRKIIIKECDIVKLKILSGIET